MTKEEVERMLRYLMKLYPNVKMTEQHFKSTIQLWAYEFKDEKIENIREALKIATTESPDWMPSVPKIKNALGLISARVSSKTKEQEFKDMHCGKSEEEWSELVSWEDSENGKEYISSLKEKIGKIIGG